MKLRLKFPATFLRYERRDQLVSSKKNAEGQTEEVRVDLGFFAIIKIGDMISAHYVGHEDKQLDFQPGPFNVIFEQVIADPVPPPPGG